MDVALIFRVVLFICISFWKKTNGTVP